MATAWDNPATANVVEGSPFGYWQPYVAAQVYTGEVPATNQYYYEWIAAGTTYCYENINADTRTRVHYEAQILYNGAAAAEGEDFYTWTRYDSGGNKLVTLYPSWEALKAAFTFPLDPIDDAEELAALAEKDITLREQYGVKRYVDGKCYYEANILNAGETDPTKTLGLKRNNWYQLTVSAINALGTPYPANETDEATYLIVTADIMPWTVNINDIEL